MSTDINMKNRAATRNIRRQGYSDLSNFAQNQQLMYNQQQKDKQIMPFLSEFLKSGYATSMVNDLQKYYK